MFWGCTQYASTCIVEFKVTIFGMPIDGMFIHHVPVDWSTLPWHGHVSLDCFVCVHVRVYSGI